MNNNFFAVISLTSGEINVFLMDSPSWAKGIRECQNAELFFQSEVHECNTYIDKGHYKGSQLTSAKKKVKLLAELAILAPMSDQIFHVTSKGAFELCQKDQSIVFGSAEELAEKMMTVDTSHFFFKVLPYIGEKAGIKILEARTKREEAMNQLKSPSWNSRTVAQKAEIISKAKNNKL